MRVSEGHATRVAASARVGAGRSLGRRPVGWRALPAVVLTALTGLGLALRLVVADQSLFADELSTFWVVSTNGLAGVVSAVHTDVEITPPLFFVAAWLAAQIDVTPELLRAPSLLAGTATIPLTYLLGLRTVGRGAALVAAALTTLSPFMIFYSAEARGYAFMVAVLLLSTLALLDAVDNRRGLSWVAYAVCACAAVYTHYTSVFALGAQLLWLLWAHPEARKPALLATVGAALAFLPWLSGLRADFNSPTTDIVDSFNTVDLGSVRINLLHWAAGHPLVLPNTSLSALPGNPALVLLALGVAVALVGVALTAVREGLGSWTGRVDRRLMLVIVLALSVPAGAALMSTVGPNLFGARYLAASWPALALSVAALLVAPPPWLRVVAVALVVAASAIAAVKLLRPDLGRPEYQTAAGLIERAAAPGDVIIDATDYSPAPPTGIDAALQSRGRVFHVGEARVQYDPFKVLAGPPDPAEMTARAARAADGARIFIVASESVFAQSSPLEVPTNQQVTDALPAGFRLTETRTYPGILRLAVLVYSSHRAPPRE